MSFTIEEEMLIKAYKCSSRQQLIDKIQKSLEWIEEPLMWEMAGNVLSKLRLMSDDEYINTVNNPTTF